MIETVDKNLDVARRGGVGIITLNRPEALNALTHGMICGISKVLSDWAVDDDIKIVIFRGAGDRAFCAGGDIKAVYHAGVGLTTPEEKTALAKVYFADEYRMNRQMFHYPKPTVALMNGIIMGGGYGVAGACRYKVVSETTKFAMPEVGIGFFPDVGVQYYLTRCADHAGYWVALTGDVIGAADMVHYNLATHFIPAAEHDHLLEEIVEYGDASVLDSLGRETGVGRLMENRDAINRIFALGSVAEIMQALESGDEFCRATAATMRTRSPFSMVLTLASLRNNIGADFDTVTARDYCLAIRFCMGHEFYEGIRAAVVDKDRKPRWDPAAVENVDMGVIENWLYEQRWAL
jgi:enoyl-CoA hydratase